mmetsp:Transcript_20922/g.45361  ORF Transcript_20922/g.45361 Transcript_20922/m.45361 type:complete len:301 (+) Transcript_20922:371-1273(+)
MPPSHSCSDGPSSPVSSPRSTPKSPSSSRPTLNRMHKSQSNIETRNELLQLAAAELEAMRCRSARPHPNKFLKQDSNGSLSSTSSSSSTNSNSSYAHEVERSFPPACLHLLHTLPGNTKCHDCHTASATWASVSYGITLCLQCSGKHRGLGVHCSFIKSLTLDSWKRREILCMLEGGNEQLSVFFDRHEMGVGRTLLLGNSNTSVGVLDRYKTKAASFYRQHLMSHAKQVAEGGLYEGREASRKSKQRKKSKTASTSGSANNKGNKSSKRKKSREGLPQKLPTVTEKELVEPACGVVGAA